MQGDASLRANCKTSRVSRPVFGENARTASLLARQDRAYRYSLNLAPDIKELLASGHTSLQQIAFGLNAKGIPAPRGGRWRKSQVVRLLKHLGLRSLFPQPQELQANGKTVMHTTFGEPGQVPSCCEKSARITDVAACNLSN